MTLPALALLTPLLLSTAAAPAATPAPAWLARVNGQPITADDLQDGFVRRHGGHRKFLAGEVETRRFLDILVDYELLMQEAYRLGLDQQPDIRKAVDAHRERRMIDLLLKTEIEDKAHPAPEAVREFWEKNTSQVFELRQIVVDGREKADELRGQLLSGADFEKLAREHSTAPSRLYGGQLRLGRGAMDPDWEQVVYSLGPGALSPVLEGKGGFEIVRLEKVEEVERPKFEEAKPRIEAILKTRLVEQRKRELAEALWTKYHASLTEAPRDLQALATAASDTPALELARWDGGSLSAGEVWPQLDAKALGSLPAFRLRRELEDRLRAVVNAPLALVEARARGLQTAPEVTAAVKRYQEDLMESALYHDYVLKDVKVSAAEVAAYYEAHRAELTVPEKRHVAHIVSRTIEQAREVRKRLEAGEAFEELARQSTDLQTVSAAGDLGWITPKEVPADFAPVLALEAGGISDPLPSKFGYHVVRVIEIQPARPLSLDEARADVEKKLLEQKQREARLAWVKQLRAAAEIRYSDRNIRAFVRQSQRDAARKPVAPGHGGAGQQRPPGH